MRKNQDEQSWAVAELEVKYRRTPKMPVEVSYSRKAYNVFLKMWDKSLINMQEQFCVLYLNNALDVLGFKQISTGSLNTVTVDVQMVFALALKGRANKIIVAHNHPSGTLKPSGEDKKITYDIKRFGDMLDIELIDHMIITDSGFYSFKDEGGLL